MTDNETTGCPPENRQFRTDVNMLPFSEVAKVVVATFSFSSSVNRFAILFLLQGENVNKILYLIFLSFVYLQVKIDVGLT